MYFLRRLRPLEVSGERVRALRVSLNTPMLSAPDLPAAPGRAVIVVHRDARGQMDATVGVRSHHSGEIAYWSFDGELASEDDLAVAADAALTFAESLGFLFDDGSLDGVEAGKAWRAWFTGEAPALSREAAQVGAGRDELLGSAAEMPELELGELIGAVDAQLAPAGEPKAAPTPAPVFPAKRILSKFRTREAVPTAPRPASSLAPAQAAVARKAPIRQPLARLQLVKRRSPEEERKLLLRRLLTSF
jgi:hypothetical protein